MISLICPIVLITNLSGEPINDRDRESFEHAKKRCAQIYPSSPCMKKFTKTKPLNYRVICGQGTTKIYKAWLEFD